MRRGIILLAVASILGAAAGCTPAGETGGDGRLRVVATTTQVGSVADEVGGDAIELTVLLAPGAEAHDYEITPQAAAAIEDADIILRSGAGLESWLDDALETIGGEHALRDMSEGIELRRVPAGDAANAGEQTEQGREAVDPHYWLNAPNAILMVDNVAGALAAADPDRASEFAQRADALSVRLEEADDRIRQLIGEIPTERRGIVTNHDALGYFIDEYGLRLVGSVFPSLDVSAEPSAADLAELIDTIRSERVVAVFSESAVSPELAQAIAREAGARVVEEPLYADSLGPPGSGAETLDAMLLHNASVIHDALVP